jgi:nucleoside-diphosphate-sugar epimerase
MKNIFITGGGGYVGSALSDYLVEQGYKVTAYDLFIYGKNVFFSKKNINLIQGDIRDLELLKLSLKGHDAVIHLACISNDPSFDLNPNLGKSINLDSFEPLVKAAQEANVKRFVFASSSSVYGIKKESNINEDMLLEPITDYSKFKAMCEKILLNYKSNNFETVIIRPATVCGFSKRQRLDVIVNILTNLAYHKREITVFGGEQLRPNIHINDMVRSYLCLLKSESSLVNGEIFNAGWENKSVNDIANIVRSNVGDDVSIVKNISNDNRSYHISSEKIKNVLNFKTNFTIENAVKDLVRAFKEKKFSNPLSNDLYFNIKKMKNINLK